MNTPVNPIPADSRGATPYLCCRDAESAIAFYTHAFGAEELVCLRSPDGSIAHAELRIGDARFMLGDEVPVQDVHSPLHYNGSPVSIHVYVADVDAFVARAVEAGASLTRPVADQFYGDRAGRLEDPCGHMWMFASRIENVSPEEMQKRFDAMMKPAG